MKDRPRHLGFAVAAALLHAVAPAATAQCQYEVTAIVRGPGCSTGGTRPVVGLSMNDHGEWVGYLGACVGGIETAVAWSPGGPLRTLNLPPEAYWSRAVDISNDGTIVGWHETTGIGRRAFIIKNGKYTRIDPLPGGNYTEAAAINSSGLVVGTWGNIATGTLDVFYWHGGEIVDLSTLLGTEYSFAFDVNSSGAITGWMGFSELSDARAFVINDNNVVTLPPVPGWITSEGHAISNRGHVAGRGFLQAGDDPIWRGILWRNGVPIDLGTLPGTTRSISRDLNDADQIVGYCHNAFQEDITPFLWSRGKMFDLRKLVNADAKFELYIPYSINNHGQILASGVLGFDGVTALLSPIASRPGDISNDCRVDEQDLILLFEEWNATSSIADIDANGIVDVFDIFQLLSDWD